jgi:hypothetical protein
MRQASKIQKGGKEKMKVKVLKLGYAAREVTSEQGMTVEEAIRSSGMEVGGYKVTLNGVGADLAAPVHENDVIALVPKVEAGCRPVQPPRRPVIHAV